MGRNIVSLSNDLGNLVLSPHGHIRHIDNSFERLPFGEDFGRDGAILLDNLMEIGAVVRFVEDAGKCLSEVRLVQPRTGHIYR